MADPLDPLRNQGLTNAQIMALADKGQAPTYLKSMIGDLNKSLNMDELRAAQGNFEAQKLAHENMGIPPTGGGESFNPDFEALGIPQVGGDATGENLPAAAPTGPVDTSQLTGVPKTQAAPPQTDKDIAQQYLERIGQSPGLSRVIKAINEQKALASDLGEKQAQLQEAYNKETEKIATKQAELEENKAKEAAKLQADIDNDVKELGQTKIDPGRFWANKTTGEKIIAGLALALSGFAQGYMGKSGPDPVMTMLQKSINDDIMSQKADYAKRREVIGEKRNAYATFMDKYKNEAAALSASKAAALERLKNEVAVMAARKSGTEAAINAEKMIGELEIQQQAANQKTALELMKQQSKRSDEMREYEVPGYGFARSKKEAEDLRTQMGNLDFSTNTIDDMIGKIDQFGTSDYLTPTQLKKDLQTAAKILRGQSRLMLLGPGTVTEEEYKRLVDTIPIGDDFTDVSRTSAKRTLKSVKKLLTDIADYQLRAKVSGYKGRIKSQLGSGATKVQ